MKLLLTGIFCCFITGLFAQTPQQIEGDLLKSFKKIARFNDKDDAENLETANDDFAKKLKIYAEKYPSTMVYPFNSLIKEHLDISSSTDGLFRIYSWDTNTGGTMHFFENVFQCKAGNKIFSIIDNTKYEGDVRPNYQRVYTFKVNGYTYYLSVYLSIGSTKDVGNGLQVFTIDNGKLVDAKLIKTHSGLHADLSYDYDFQSVVNIEFGKRPTIRFDDKTNTIYLPMVGGNRNMTNKFIQYKFTGQYFEKVKTK